MVAICGIGFGVCGGGFGKSAAVAGSGAADYPAGRTRDAGRHRPAVWPKATAIADAGAGLFLHRRGRATDAQPVWVWRCDCLWQAAIFAAGGAAVGARCVDRPVFAAVGAVCADPGGGALRLWRVG